MSQPDLLTELRESRPVAPAEVREHIRQIALQAATPRRRSVNWRRALLVAIPVAAAAAGASLLLPGGSGQTAAERQLHFGPPAHSVGPNVPELSPPVQKSASAGQALTNLPTLGIKGAPSTVSGSAGGDLVPSTNPHRVQRVSAELQLRVPNAQAVSDGAKQAAAIARSLGGYSSRIDVSAAGRTGYADLTLRIPKQNVQKAVSRLSALGTITGESVSIEDIQAQVDATGRKIARLYALRAGWEAQPQTTLAQRHIVSLTDEIVRLRRERTTTVKNAGYATVAVEMTTRQAPAPPHHGKSHFHGLAVAFRWIGIGAVYALALGAPAALLLGLVFLAARAVRRRRVDALLSRP